MNEWQMKVWGKTREIIDSPYYSKHELEIEIGGYSSLHYHRHRANIFQVISGLVEIIEMFGPKITRTLVGQDNTFSVASLVPHMFVVHKSGRMLEEYYPDRGGVVTRDDIIRLCEGGKKDILEIPKLPYILFPDELCCKTK